MCSDFQLLSHLSVAVAVRVFVCVFGIHGSVCAHRGGSAACICVFLIFLSLVCVCACVHAWISCVHV